MQKSSIKCHESTIERGLRFEPYTIRARYYKIEMSDIVESSRNIRNKIHPEISVECLTVFKCGEGSGYFKEALVQTKSGCIGTAMPIKLSGVTGIIWPISETLYQDLKKHTMTKVFFKGFTSYATRSAVAMFFERFGLVEFIYFMSGSKKNLNPYKMVYIYFCNRNSVEKMFNHSNKLKFDKYTIRVKEYQANKKPQAISRVVMPSSINNKSQHVNIWHADALDQYELKRKYHPVHPYTQTDGLVKHHNHNCLLNKSKYHVRQTLLSLIDMNTRDIVNMRFNMNHKNMPVYEIRNAVVY